MDLTVNVNSIDYKVQEILNRKVWDTFIQLFDDANIYQTWNYAQIGRNERNVKHLVIYKNDIVIGLAQVRIRTIKFLKRGIAYIANGPIWQKCDQAVDLETFFNICNILKKIFCEDQKLVLRINPQIFSDELWYPVLFDNIPGYNRERIIKRYRSLLLSLYDDLISIRKSFNAKWRNHLNRAEKSSKLEIVNGNSSKLFDTFLTLYDQLVQLKNFVGVDPRSFRSINDEMSENFKLQIFIAYEEKLPVAGLICSAIGNTGVYLFGASNEKGRKYNAAYLLQWEVIQYLKSKGIKRYDLGGIDPVNNPNVYTFKSGISDNELWNIGTYSASTYGISKLLVYGGDVLISLIKYFKNRLKKI